MKTTILSLFLGAALLAPAAAGPAQSRGRTRQNVVRQKAPAKAVARAVGKSASPRRAAPDPTTPESAPTPQAGALILSAGRPTVIGPSSPQTLHVVDGGSGMIAADPKLEQPLDTHRGVWMGAPDKAPGTSAGSSGSASGKTGVSVRTDQ